MPEQTSVTKKRETSVQHLLRLAAPAYRLAVYILDSPDAADDVVQQSYFEALGKLQPGSGEKSERTWFLTLVANRAKDFGRRERSRKKREATVDISRRSSAVGDAMITALREALSALDAEYRLPLLLCYQEDMSQNEVAAVLQMPQTTVSKRIRTGLAKLRKALERAGYPAAVAAVLGGLKSTAPVVPASLATSVEKIVAGQVAQAAGSGAGPLAGSASVLAKGGIAMKVVAGVVLAGALAGAVAVSTGMGRGGPLASPGEGKPAPVNPYKGMQEREEVYEFTAKPAVKKDGDKWVITFASKGKCDATVWAEAPDGKVVAHIASGVLGANAPHPLQPNSLSQRVEWDGKADTGKPLPGGCRVKVGLGLKASFERILGWDPQVWAGNPAVWKVKHVVFADGTICVVGKDQVRLYDKDGKYLKTLAPHPSNLGKDRLGGFTWVKTIYGNEEVPVPAAGRSWRANFHDFRSRGMTWSADPAAKQVIMTVSNQKGPKHYAIGTDGGFNVAQGPGPAKLVDGPGKLAAPSLAPEATFIASVNAWPRICADPFRDEVYVRWEGHHVNPKGIARYDGKTGALDKTWPDIGMELMDFGPDGLLYARVGSYGMHVARFDHAGKVVNFPKGVVPKKGYYSLPEYLNKYGEPFTVISFGTGGCQTQQKGFVVSPVTGDIYVDIQYVHPAWAAQNCKEWKKGQTLLAVFAPDGSLKCANAILDMPCHHGLGIDRWNNIYKGVKDMMPAGQQLFEGLSTMPAGRPGSAGSANDTAPPAGSVVKFRGGPFPLGAFRSSKEKAEGVRLDVFRVRGRGSVAEKALWAYGGVSPLGGSSCTCCHSMFDTDPFGRSFLPQAYTYSVMVVDANGNKVLRVGKYGNADSQGPKSAVLEPEIGFVWVRAVSATDRALYALDCGNRRVLKAGLSYHAEETVPTP